MDSSGHGPFCGRWTKERIISQSSGSSLKSDHRESCPSRACPTIVKATFTAWHESHAHVQTEPYAYFSVQARAVRLHCRKLFLYSVATTFSCSGQPLKPSIDWIIIKLVLRVSAGDHSISPKTAQIVPVSGQMYGFQIGVSNFKVGLLNG